MSIYVISLNIVGFCLIYVLPWLLGWWVTGSFAAAQKVSTNCLCARCLWNTCKVALQKVSWVAQCEEAVTECNYIWSEGLGKVQQAGSSGVGPCYCVGDMIDRLFCSGCSHWSLKLWLPRKRRPVYYRSIFSEMDDLYRVLGLVFQACTVLPHLHYAMAMDALLSMLDEGRKSSLGPSPAETWNSLAKPRGSDLAYVPYI